MCAIYVQFMEIHVHRLRSPTDVVLGIYLHQISIGDSVICLIIALVIRLQPITEKITLQRMILY